MQSGKVYSNSNSTKSISWKHSGKWNCTLGLLSKDCFETDFGDQRFAVGKEKIKAGLGRTLRFSTQNVHVAMIFHEFSSVDGRVGTNI